MEPKNATEQKKQEVQRTRETENSGRRQTKRRILNASVSEIRDSTFAVLSMGKESQRSNVRSLERRTKREKAQGQVTGHGSRNQSPQGSDSGSNCIEYRVKKKSFAIVKYKHLSRESKQEIIDYISWLNKHSYYNIEDILQGLDISRNKYNYWLKSVLKPNEIKPRKKILRLQKATPDEVESVKEYVINNPGLGYKRYTYNMLDENIVALKEHQVYEIMRMTGLLMFGKRVTGVYKRPPKPTAADQVWHIDIMYLWIYDRWYYLVDIIDGYSRFLIHWKIFSTMHANTVVETMQEAIDMMDDKEVRPHIVHDNGKQFLASLWTDMIKHNQLTDVKIRVHHPQSNGTVERLHRTHREECFNKEPDSYAQAVDMMTKWTYEYNHKRPHSSLNYLCPVDYYYGNPEQRLKDRNEKINIAMQSRKRFWLNQYEQFKLAV